MLTTLVIAFASLGTLAIVVSRETFTLVETIGTTDEKRRALDKDLSVWIKRADEQLHGNEMRIRYDQRQAGAYTYLGKAQRTKLRSDLVEQWEDRLEEAERELRQTLLAEHWPHRLYRRLARRPVSKLVAPAVMQHITKGWSEPIDFDGEERFQRQLAELVQQTG